MSIKILKIVITALALIATAYLIPGIVVTSLWVALLVAVLLGIINACIKPMLFVLTLPINIITLGLFTFIVNGFLFWLVARFVDGFIVHGFWTAVLGAFIVSVFSWFGNKLLKD